MNKPLAGTALESLLPSSIAWDAGMCAAATGLQPIIDDTQAAIALIELQSRIDELPEPILHLLAWENRMAGVEWVLAKTLSDKRELVKNSFMLNKLRGTRWAVERVFTLLRLEAQIVEWFEEGGDPYTFRVAVLDVGDRGIATDELALLDQLIDAYKPLTRANTGINMVAAPPEANGYLGFAVTMTGVIETEPAT